MKRLFPLMLFSLFISTGSCFCMENEEFLDQFIQGFKMLPRTEQAQRIANARFVDGYLETVPDLKSAFDNCPEKKQEFFEYAHQLEPEIKVYCWHRLDDTFQGILARFQALPDQERKSVIFSFDKENGLHAYLLPDEEMSILKPIENVPEQWEPFFVLASLMQAETHTTKKTPTPAHHTPEPHRHRLAALLLKAKHLIGVKG